MDIDGIVEQWRDPTADRTYLERVWLNRLVRSSERAFDAEKWPQAADPDHIVPDGAKITLGFDGSRYNDATAIVGCEIETGYVWLVGLWEHPFGIVEWEVPEHEVKAAMADAFARYDVWRLYCDPPYWESAGAEWAGEYGDERVMFWRTNRQKPMAEAIRSFDNAIKAGDIRHSGDRRFSAHVGNAVRRVLTLRDDQGIPYWSVYKERPDSPLKIDGFER